jgi:hypothetical protein
MLLSKQPGDTGIYATATSNQVQLYYVLDRVLPYVAGKATSAAEGGSFLGNVGRGGRGSIGLAGLHVDEARAARRVAAAPACVPREHLRMLYRLTATGTGADRTGGVLRAADSPAATVSSPCPATSPHTPSSATHGVSPIAYAAEHTELRLQDEAASVYRWGSPLIPFHTVPCRAAAAAISGSDSARLFSTHGKPCHHHQQQKRSSQEWATPSAVNAEDTGVLASNVSHFAAFNGAFPMGAQDAGGNVYMGGGGHSSWPASVIRNGRSMNSARGLFGSGGTAVATPTALSLSSATDCLLFFLANSEGYSWIGRSDAASLSPLRVSTSLQTRRHGGVTAGAGGGRPYHAAASSSSPRPPRPSSAPASVPGNTSFPTHSLVSSEQAATPPNTIADDSLPAAVASLSDSDSGSNSDNDDSIDNSAAGEACDDAAHVTGGPCGHHRRGNSIGPMRPSSVDGLEAFSGVPSTMISLPAARVLSRHDRVITASGWDPRNSAILALGRQGGIVQLLDVEYVIGSAASTRCSSTTNSAASDDTAEPFASSANGGARTMTSGGGGGPCLPPYSGANHLSYSVVQQREMVGPVTALDWMPQSHLTVVAARRRDGLGCYAELLDLRASHDGVTYLGAPPEVFGVPVYARGGENTAPSVLCSAERVACHPSQRYVATVGGSRARDIVQLWDIRMATRPVAYQVYARAGYTSLCWSATETGVVLGTTRDGGLRAHSFKELGLQTGTTASRSNGAVPGGSSGEFHVTAGGGSAMPTVFSGGSHRSHRHRGASSSPPHPLVGGSGGESTMGGGGPEALQEHWGAGNSGHGGHNPSNNGGYSGTEAEAEDDVLEDSGSLRSGVSFDGAGTALSSTTESSNALVHVSVKAQSALKCRLPSRVPAAAVAWVCRPSAEEGGKTGSPGGLTNSLPPHACADSVAAAHRRHSDVESERDWGSEGEEGKSACTKGVVERGCRTDLPQLLLLNAKNGELYTQVYNPRGSIVTMLNHSMRLVGVGPNAFIARSPAAYETVTHVHEELLMQQLERQAVREATARSVKAASGRYLTSASYTAENGTSDDNVATLGTRQGNPAAGETSQMRTAGGGGGAAAAASAAPAAAARRVTDHPVDLMGLGLLDEEDEEDEEVNEDGGVGSEGAEGEVRDDEGRNEAVRANTSVSGPGDHRADGYSSNNGDVVAESGNGGAARDMTPSGTRDCAGVPPRIATAPFGKAASFISHEQTSSPTEPLPSRRGQPNTNERAAEVRATSASAITDERVAHHHHHYLPVASRPMSPLAEGGGPAESTAQARSAVPPPLEVPQELGYCQFHRIERPQLIWHRLRCGFSCNPIANLRVLLNEGLDREAYAAFLYGCCASLLLYPVSAANVGVQQGPHAADVVSPLRAILGARHAVPGLLELLVSERRLRAQLGLQDARLSARFRLRQHPSTQVSTAVSTTAGPTTGPLPSPISPTAVSTGPLGFAVPLLQGLPGLTDRAPHRGPPGFFCSPLDSATTMRVAGGQLATQGTLNAAGGGMRVGNSAGALAEGHATTILQTLNSAPELRGSSYSDSPHPASTGNGNSGYKSDAATEEPTHTAAVGMLRQLILQSMGWVAPPVPCRIDGESKHTHNTDEADTRQLHGSPKAASTAPRRAAARHPPRHPADCFFVQGDGLGQRSLQEALERRVALLVLLDRLEEAAELLSLYGTHNPQYPSIALTLSAACGQASALLSLATPECPGVTFWVHLLLTYVRLLMDQQHAIRTPPGALPTLAVDRHDSNGQQTACATVDQPSLSDRDDGMSTEATTRFDKLFTLAEQKVMVLRLLRGYPRLAMPDKVALATALLLPPYYHDAHLANLIEVLQILVHQQYRAYTGDFDAASTAANASVAALSTAGTAGTSPYASPATSPPQLFGGQQRRAEGKRLLSSPLPLTRASQQMSASTPLTAVAPPRLQGCNDARDSIVHDVAIAGAASAKEHFASVCGCSLLLVTAVEGVSTDCRALQRYVDESGDTQTSLCYTVVFGNVTTSTFRLWREAYRDQLNDAGFSMWRSQFDLQWVKLVKVREEVECDAASDGRAEGGSGIVGPVTGLGFDMRNHRVGGRGCGSGAPPGVPGVLSGVGGGSGGSGGGADGPGAVTTTGAAAALPHAGMKVPKGLSGALGPMGGEMVAASTSSAAAMMTTQTAMMMKRTLKGFAQTTATTTADRDRSMRDAAAASTAGANATDLLHRNIELRCNCGQAMHATALGKGSFPSMASTNLTRKQLIPCGNPECRQWQTPMCTVCGERMEHRATELPPERFFAWCSVCLHGGHWCHLREWFSKHTKCPVENCPCHCYDDAHPT